MDSFDARLGERLARLESAAPGPIVAPERQVGSRWNVARGSVAVAAALALAAFVAGAAVGRYVDSNEPVARPGLENPGQPFHGVGLQCMTPREAQAVIVAKGFDVWWQIEDRDSNGNGTTTFSASPPRDGVVEAGFIDGMTAHVVVSVGSGATPFDWCK
jgi:hypothetical protein